MNKSIDTLAKDIYHVLNSDHHHEPSASSHEGATLRIGEELLKSTEQRNKPREHGRLWASDLGKKCLRQHWYNFNEPEHGEKLGGHTKFKFLYGNLLEESVLWLAEEAGHSVTNQQDRVEWDCGNGWMVSGRIDAIIDGVLIDVKSTSSYGFKNYKDGIDATNDTFGYLYQLGFYNSFGDFGTELEGVPGFVWIDKQNGHIAYSSAVVPTADDITERAHEIVQAVEGTEADTKRAFGPEPYGKSGNMKLATGCSYCAFKHRCWRDSNNGNGLRTFLYSHGPVYFTDITRPPKATILEV